MAAVALPCCVAKPEYSPAFVAWARAQPMTKRASTALEILLERGSVTTAELNRLGYDHPPRAIGDVKDAGLSIASQMVNVDGVRMAQYTLLDAMGGDEAIRRQLPKKFREQLYELHDYRCAACGGQFTGRELQTDHRIPFRIAGDPEHLLLDDFMPLCGSDNRSKSMTCEKCPNWTIRDATMCRSCYWADPDDYRHIAGEPERRLVISVRGADVQFFDNVAVEAARHGLTPGDYVTERLSDLL